MESISFREKQNIDYSYSNNMKNQVEDLKYKYLSLWWEAKTDFPKFKNKTSFFEKLSNERKVEKFRKELHKELKDIPEDESNKKKWSKKILYLIKELEYKISGNEDSTIDFFSKRGYADVTEQFIREVEKFDSNMNVFDVFQAIRNVWIMNSVQILFNMKVKLTPSIFSYSMMYPYSDNYLDDNNISIQAKKKFNNKFRKWLLGEEEKALNTHERKILELMKMIEDEFSREKYPKAFESLLAIHIAQEKSLIQQSEISIPYEKNLIDITLEKGGTSVLADGYLVKGELLRKEADFMFGYGVFLQLIDDLQDVKEDLKNSHMTIFSQVATKWNLDKLTNKLFWFIEEILETENIFLSDDSIKLREIIHESCIIMIFEAISKNKNLFSRRYVKEIENHSMIRFSYYKKLKKKLKKDYSSDDIYNICDVLSNNIFKTMYYFY